MDLCKYCEGICCLNPPQLYPEEAERVKEAGAELIGFENDGKVFVAVKPVDKKCPFLEYGKCSIYEMRPEACRSFECVNMHTPLDEIIKGDPAAAITGFVKPYRSSNAGSDIGWSMETAERLGVHIVPMGDFIATIAAKDVVDVIAMTIRTFVNVGER